MKRYKIGFETGFSTCPVSAILASDCFWGKLKPSGYPWHKMKNTYGQNCSFNQHPPMYLWLLNIYVSTTQKLGISLVQAACR